MRLGNSHSQQLFCQRVTLLPLFYSWASRSLGSRAGMTVPPFMSSPMTICGWILQLQSHTVVVNHNKTWAIKDHDTAFIISHTSIFYDWNMVLFTIISPLIVSSTYFSFHIPIPFLPPCRYVVPSSVSMHSNFLFDEILVFTHRKYRSLSFIRCHTRVGCE